MRAKNDAIRAERKADMYGSLSLFLVYCELVEPELVGHTKAPFLSGKTMVVFEFCRYKTVYVFERYTVDIVLFVE